MFCMFLLCFIDLVFLSLLLILTSTVLLEPNIKPVSKSKLKAKQSVLHGKPQACVSTFGFCVTIVMSLIQYITSYLQNDEKVLSVTARLTEYETYKMRLFGFLIITVGTQTILAYGFHFGFSVKKEILTLAEMVMDVGQQRYHSDINAQR